MKWSWLFLVLTWCFFFFFSQPSTSMSTSRSLRAKAAVAVNSALPNILHRQQRRDDERGQERKPARFPLPSGNRDEARAGILRLLTQPNSRVYFSYSVTSMEDSASQRRTEKIQQGHSPVRARRSTRSSGEGKTGGVGQGTFSS